MNEIEVMQTKITLDDFQRNNRRLYKQHKELGSREAALLDWVIGLAGETGELSELVKHNLFHEQEVDVMEYAKEVGDVLWYLAAIADTFGFSLQHAMELNKAKLDHRYPDNFNKEASAERKEREEWFHKSAEYHQLKEKITGVASR